MGVGHAWIAPESGAPGFLVARTERSLRARGWTVIDALAEAGDEPILIARPGMWCLDDVPPFLPSHPKLVGLAMARSASPDWQKMARRCGGVWSRLPKWRRRFPSPPVVAYLGGEAVHSFRERMNERGFEWDRALAGLAFDSRWNSCLLSDFAVDHDSQIRSVQVVTSFQIGGAEKIALSLAEGLAAMGRATLAIATGKGLRPNLPRRSPSVEVSADPDEIAAIERRARAHGADLLHTHLLDRSRLADLSAAGWPVVTTLHNLAHALPEGVTELDAGEADLVLGCAREAERQWRLVAGEGPVSRTLWNGVERPVRQSSDPVGLRESRSIPSDAIVLLALANVRPQKRFDRLAGILEATRRRLKKPVHLLLAGDGTESPEFFSSDENVHGLGLLEDPALAIEAADVLISCSAHEGLSLSQLETLALGKPVVATDVGGAREVGVIQLVPEDAESDRYAEAIDQVLYSPAVGLPRSFSRQAMVERADWLYERALAQRPVTGKKRPRVDWWLVTNNFHTGGAQSSARRLLEAMRGRGFVVRATVVEEGLYHVSRGTRELNAAGIPVSVAPPIPTNDASVTCRELLREMDRHEVGVVVFWNLITSCKIILADALWTSRVYDVSPGEMYYDSLERYFERPRTGLPYQNPLDYGERLAGLVVKYEAERESAARKLGCPVRVIPNGLPLFATRERKTGGNFVIGSTARLSPDKRLEELLAAFRLALPQMPPGCELHIAGGPDGGNRAYAKKLNRSARGLPVRWLGEITGIGEFLAGCDAFAMISEPAGCPNASIEAMAAGLPLVLTDHGGARDQVTDGVNGLLVPRADAGALAEALIRLSRDADLRRQLGTSARAVAEERFSIDRMVEDYLQFTGGGNYPIGN